MTIGEQIKARRLELKLTQEDLAKMCNKTGEYISQIENGKRRKNDGLLDLFAALGLEMKLEVKK